LREGWDNPNVFQICTLRDINTERERRQTIGRGLRLCVNQQGERERGFDVNTLTVIANESYEQFAENLQREIEADTGIRFGVVAKDQFAALAAQQDDGTVAPFGQEKSVALWQALKAKDYINAQGKVQDELRKAIKDGRLALPAEFEPLRDQIAAVLRKLAGRIEVKDAEQRKTVRTRQAVLHSPEFKALWNRIKHKTTYRVAFDNEELIQKCAEAVQQTEKIAKTQLQWRIADVAIGRGGVQATETASTTVGIDDPVVDLPDVLTDLQDRTQLTRRSLQKILVQSRRLADFKRNPQKFIEQAAEAINRCKRLAIIDGIKYQRLGDAFYYAQELFETNELQGYLKNMLETQRSVYESVVYDSTIERDFALELEKNEAVKVYAKLPGWFKVPTPLGTYNPDWAVSVQCDDSERIYFVVETKSSLFADDLRNKERAKIECGKAHFEALAVEENPARYVVANNVATLLSQM
jgi:type III restriction enzyme